MNVAKWGAAGALFYLVSSGTSLSYAADDTLADVSTSLERERAAPVGSTAEVAPWPLRRTNLAQK